jgi:hypothetical protein
VEWDPQDAIQLLGFDPTSNARLICTRRQRDGFRPVTVDLDRRVVEDWYDLAQAKADDPTLMTNRMKDEHGDMVVLSADGTMAAVTAADTQGKRSFLRVYTSSGKVFDHELPMAAKVALDPVGLSFSPDGAKVAVACVAQGQTSIFSCATLGNDRAVRAWFTDAGSTGTGSGETKSGTAARVIRTNELTWLAGGDHWLYGKMIADGPTRRYLGTVDLGQTTAQQTVVNGQQLMALVNNGSAVIQATIIAASSAETADPTAPTAP